MADVHDAIRQFILTHHLPGESAENLHNDTPLLTSGILDSLAAYGLIMHLEQLYGVELTVYDTAIERFDCIADMAAVVATKQAARSSAAGTR